MQDSEEFGELGGGRFRGLTDAELRQKLSDPDADIAASASSELEQRARILGIESQDFVPFDVSEFVTHAQMQVHRDVWHGADPVSPDALETLREELGDDMARSFNVSQASIASVDARLVGAIEALQAQTNRSLTNLESQIVTLQSDIEDSALSAQEVGDASGEGGLLGFVGRVTGFMTNPLEAFLERVGDWILGEVIDGLNR